MTETLFNQRPNPCRGCLDRYPARHGHCEKPERLKWLEESKKITENRRKYQAPAWARQEGYVRGRK